MKIAILFILLLNIGIAQEFYVAKNGSDNNPGTKEKPFLTLQAAKNAVREYKKNIADIAKIIIWIREGKYYLNETFRLDERDSGNEKLRIEYKSFNDEKVTISGGRPLNPKEFVRVTNPAVINRTPKESRGKLVYYDLRKSGITNYGELKQIGHSISVVPAPLELFIDSKIMTLARYPNEGFILIGDVIDEGSIPRIGDYSNRGGKFKYTDRRHERWVNAEDLWLQGTFKHGYADDMIKVEHIDLKSGTVKLQMPHLYGIGSGENFNHYYALNLLEEVDSPGEYYVDRKNGILYLYPPYDLSKSSVEVSILEKPIVSLINCSNITFSGITFETCRGIGIYIEGGDGNIVEGSTVRNTGTSGIFMGKGARQTVPYITIDHYEGVPVSEEIGNLQGHLYDDPTWERDGGKNHKIISCDVYSTGSGAIYLSGGSKKQLVNGNCLVENCKIYDYTRRNKFLWSAVNVDGCGNIVRHNEIFNSDYQGIYVHGNEHLFEYNYIHDVAKNSNDVSAWYTGRDPSDRGNVIRYNYFENIGRPDRKWTMCVYFDDAACDGLVESNIFYKAGSYGAFYSNAGQDLIVRNNIFIDIFGPVLQLKSMWWDFAADAGNWNYFFGEKGVYRKRLTKLLDIKSAPYSLKYPNLINWMDLTSDSTSYYGMYPARNIFENNVLFNCEETTRLVGPNAQFEMKNNFITRSDPGFEDLKNKNFRLKENSIVFDKIKGFRQIPVEKIGLYKDDFRK